MLALSPRSLPVEAARAAPAALSCFTADDGVCFFLVILGFGVATDGATDGASESEPAAVAIRCSAEADGGRAFATFLLTVRFEEATDGTSESDPAAAIALDWSAPTDFRELVEAMLLFFLLASDFLVRYRLRIARPQPARKEPIREGSVPA